MISARGKRRISAVSALSAVSAGVKLLEIYRPKRGGGAVSPLSFILSIIRVLRELSALILIDQRLNPVRLACAWCACLPRCLSWALGRRSRAYALFPALKKGHADSGTEGLATKAKVDAGLRRPSIN